MAELYGDGRNRGVGTEVLPGALPHSWDLVASPDLPPHPAVCHSATGVSGVQLGGLTLTSSETHFHCAAGCRLLGLTPRSTCC